MKYVLHLGDLRHEYDVPDGTPMPEIVTTGLRQILDANDEIGLPLVGELYYETDEDTDESILFSVPLYLADAGEHELATLLLDVAKELPDDSPVRYVWEIVKNARRL